MLLARPNGFRAEGPPYTSLGRSPRFREEESSRAEGPIHRLWSSKAPKIVSCAPHGHPSQFWHSSGSAASIPFLSRLDPSNPRSRPCSIRGRRALAHNSQLTTQEPSHCFPRRPLRSSLRQAKYLGSLRQPTDSKPLTQKEIWRVSYPNQLYLNKRSKSPGHSPGLIHLTQRIADQVQT